MADEWKTTKLGDIAEINPDSIDRSWPHSHIRYIDISSVGVGQLESSPQVLKLGEAPSRAKRIVKTGDTVLSTVRPNRRSMFFVSQPGNDWIVSTGFAVLRPKSNLVDPRFLYACVFNQQFTDYLVTQEKGAAYPAVSPEDIANAEMLLPPLREQQAIACILGALDDKIELNRRRNRTLEGMARAIFQSWFVDFDPVKAKAAGRTPPGLKPELAALFPDSFQDSPLGPIPHGWDVKSVADVTFRVTKGDTPRNEAIKAASENERWIPMLRVNAITDEGEILIDKAERIPESIHFGKSKRSILEPNDILYTNAGTIGRIAFVQPEFLPANTNQAIAIVKPNPNLIPPCYLYMTLRRPAFQEELHKDIVQAVQANLALGKISEAKFIRPPEDLVERLFFPVNSILNQIWHSRKQSRTLSDLRDTLLPKLIAGEFRVPDAERIVERTV